MAVGGQIRLQDKRAFAAAAGKIGVWLLVRGANSKSLDYIGQPDCTPKPIDCKAKTAQLGPDAGLVVNPCIAQGAFTEPKLSELRASWNTKDNPLIFSPRAALYSIEQMGPRQGCVKLSGKYIYGDYDLKAVVVPGHESATVALVTEVRGVQNARRGPKFYEVQREVNNAIGVEMVQHGADDEFTSHTDESVFVFGPKGEYKELHGLMAIQQWYENEFHGRDTGNAKSTGGVPAGVTPGIRGVVQPDGTIRPVTFGKR
jgi:hypothetical protein